VTTNSQSFEYHRWHSPEYVESWATRATTEASRRPLRKKLVSLLPFERAAIIRVLDVATGAGALSLEILSAYPNARVVCHDYSEAMLTRARQELAQFSKQVVFVKSDLLEPMWTQVIEGTFDAVVSSFALHDLTKRVKEIFGEVFALVKPGGCFLNCDYVAPPGPVLEVAYFKAELTTHQATIKKEMGVDKSYEELEKEFHDRQHRLLSPPTITNELEWLVQAGFNEVDCLWKDMRRAILGGFKHDR